MLGPDIPEGLSQQGDVGRMAQAWAATVSNDGEEVGCALGGGSTILHGWFRFTRMCWVSERPMVPRTGESPLRAALNSTYELHYRRPWSSLGMSLLGPADCSIPHPLPRW